jgi:DHA1 family tetracycline resistance protein-like MFS transporter
MHLKSYHNSQLGIIFLVIFIDLIGFGIVIPLLPLYADKYGASPFVIGLLAVSFSGMQFLFNPVWGRISDKIGRRPIILFSVTGSVISYALFGWAPSLLWLFISRIAAGFFGANIATAMAYIADLTTPENRAKGMGLIGAAFGLGFILGPALGGFLGQYSYSFAGYGASLLSFVALTLALFRLPESLRPAKNQNTVLPNQKVSLLGYFKPIGRAVRKPEIAQPLIVYFLVVLAVSNMQMTFPLFTKAVFRFDVKENGYLFAYVGILAALLQGGMIGKLSKKFGDGPLAICGTGMSMVGLAFIPFAKTIPVLLILLTVLGIGTGLNTPTLISLVSVSTDESLQGGILGVNRSVSSLARILGPLWGGWTYGALGMNWPYWTAGVVLFFAVLMALPLWRIRPSYTNKTVLVNDVPKQSG